MKITKVEEQGLRLTMSMAKTGKQATIPQLAQEEGLSEALVAKILAKLRKGGVVNAVRGRSGGYVLASSPSDINLTQIMIALNVPVLQGCYNREGREPEPCPHVCNCGLRPVLRYIEVQLEHLFEGITLADLLSSEGHIHHSIMNLWTNTPRDQALDSTDCRLPGFKDAEVG